MTGHYEGTDVGEYCPAEDSTDVSNFDIAEHFTGTVTPWTLHKIRGYEDEGNIKIDITVTLLFDI